MKLVSPITFFSILLSLLLISCTGTTNDPTDATDSGQDTGTIDGDVGDLSDAAAPELPCFNDEAGEISSGWCVIDDVCIEEGDADSDNGCMVCDPASSVDSWSVAPDETPCTVDTGDEETAGTCQSGECVPDDDTCECEEESPCCDGCDVINAGGDCDDDDLPCTGRLCSESGACQLTVIDGWCLLGDGTGADPLRCTDTADDPENCGVCGNVCPVGNDCVAGDCIPTCDDGLDICSDECVDLQSDDAHCGACDHACAQDHHCSGGECIPAGCVCDDDTFCCDGCLAQNLDQACAGGDPALSQLSCIEQACNQLGQCGVNVNNGWCLVGDGQSEPYRCSDTMNDSANCGQCGNRCAEGSACLSGECVSLCDEDLKLCGNACVNLQTDTENCGLCDRACPAHYTCEEGACQIGCAEGLSVCGNACKNLQTDRINCGTCDNQCEDGYRCSEGTCSRSCSGGTTACGDECITLHSDILHCGSCDNACPEGAICSSGQCIIRVTRITLEPTRLDLTAGNTGSFTITISPENATYSGISWRSDNTNVATVDGEGIITGVSAGYATITATAGGKSASGLVVVGFGIESITIEPPSLSLQINEQAALTANIIPATASDKRVTWSSGDDTIATVSSTGAVTARALGETIITATTVDGGMTATCSVSVVGISVESVEVTPSESFIQVFKSVRLTATVSPTNASNKSVVWESSAPGVAFVGNTGLVTGISAGTAVITATSVDGSVTGSATVTVLEPVTGVQLTPDPLMIPVNGTNRFIVGIIPPTASNKAVTWRSANTAIATVDATGLIQGKALGQTTITVETDDGHFTDTATVQIVTPVSGVTISPKTLNLTTTGSAPLTATIAPPNATNKNVTWETSAAWVATVSNTGLVQAVGLGQATITVRTVDGNHTDTTVVTVRNPVTGVSITPESVVIPVGDTETLTATISPTNATDKSVTWESLDPAVATVDSDGVVTAVGNGSTIIRVTTVDGDFTADCAVTVDIYIWARSIASSSSTYPEDMELDGAGNVLVTGYFNSDIVFEGGPSFNSTGSNDAYVAKHDSDGNLIWAKAFSGSSSDLGKAIAVDSAGNVTVAGYTNSSPMIIDGVSLSSYGSTDIFIAQFNASGQLNWAKRFGSANSDIPYDVAVDGAGNIYMVGYYSGDMNFGGGNLPYYGATNSYVVKLDSSGNHLWSKAFISYGGGTYAKQVAVDSAGSVIVGGYYYSDMEVEGEPLFNPFGGWSAPYLAKYDSAGNKMWARAYSAMEGDITAMALDGSGNIHVTGYYSDMMDWGGGILPMGWFTVYIAKLDGNGDHIWSKGGFSSSDSYSHGITVDQSGNVYLSGYFYMQLNLGGDTFYDDWIGTGFLGKFASNGSHLWSTSYRSDTNQQVNGRQIKADSDGRVVFSGIYYQQMTFGSTTLTTPNQGTFIVKLKP